MFRTNSYMIKKIKILLFPFLAILFIISNLFLEMPEDYYESHIALGNTAFEICGVVTEKFIDSNNHNYPNIIIEDKSDVKYKCYFQTNNLVFYNLVGLGDSIKSKQYSRQAYIIDSLTIKQFDFIENKVILTTDL